MTTTSGSSDSAFSLPPGSLLIGAFAAEFGRYRSMSERAAVQLPWGLLREALDPETNSIAVIMKHVGGNLRSRWTEPFTSDGEKPWRDRDGEFVDGFAADASGREALEAQWRAGWGVLEGALGSFADADLARTVRIRGEAHTLALALTRSLSHVAYHGGQIVQLARTLAGRHGLAWSTLTVARGGSKEFNAGMGFEAQKG